MQLETKVKNLEILYKYTKNEAEKLLQANKELLEALEVSKEIIKNGGPLSLYDLRQIDEAIEHIKNLKVKTICAWCDTQIETIGEAVPGHSICKDCLDSKFPEFKENRI